MALGVADPRRWLLGCAEPAAQWVTLTAVLDRPADDPEVVAAHQAVVADSGTRELLDRLPDWTAGDDLGGHSSPRFAPNLLNLLFDLGVTPTDDPRIDRLLDQMLDHQDGGGRFEAYAARRAGEAPVWGALLCDSHAVLDVLVRAGRTAHPKVQAGLQRLAADVTQTAQGPAWPCRPHPVTGFRGPGRRNDFCPQVTLEGLRVLARAQPPSPRPEELLAVARVALRAWRMRATEKPYMFGHGKGFKTAKWPPTWYGAYAVLDALGRYPALWRGGQADPADRVALADLSACLVRYNLSVDGTVTPGSTFQGFASFSFGQKRTASGFATARVLAVLHRLDELAAEAAAVDVSALGSSKGGTGTARPPVC
ncbi:hypothetical protein [Actinoplanes awajinensis]|uniref:Squalene cyclase C-terminal domain-containing protein n=1 Tax=Actinoplanes awajinensis subsp. mycoplanecinus TaxID=135947 RepID=A0A101JEX1_9ACTN|nr:hypothetical protein [Actinoplanes awajinensis]KUL25609.1 hypothetical protein ADL15_40410 [Actinoplanes awajinensis subsp. mycoplanecinus]